MPHYINTIQTKVTPNTSQYLIISTQYKQTVTPKHIIMPQYINKIQTNSNPKHITMPHYFNTIQTNSKPQTHHYASLSTLYKQTVTPQNIIMPQYIKTIQTNSKQQTHHYASLYQHNTNKQ